MDEVLKRLKASVNHLIAVDEFFAKNDREYCNLRDKLNNFKDFSKMFYLGKRGRQMILGDLLAYILVSRGSMFGYTKSNRSDYLKIILYVINQLLLQEPITTKEMVSVRKDLMETLQKENIPGFFEDEVSKELYEKAKTFSEKDLSYQDDTKELYFIVDSLLPKSIGSVIELIVYIYLIRHNFGYVIPLTLHQRLLGKAGYLISPNFLIIKNGKIFGIEVKQAGKGAPSHIFSFMSETTIPVVVASIPNTVPLRCYECNKWILYCDEVIEKFSDISQDIKEIKLFCTECAKFEQCKHVIYNGPLESGGREYHYHLECVKEKPYVKNLLNNEEEKRKRLIAYFPYVQGLDRLLEI